MSLFGTYRLLRRYEKARDIIRSRKVEDVATKDDDLCSWAEEENIDTAGALLSFGCSFAGKIGCRMAWCYVDHNGVPISLASKEEKKNGARLVSHDKIMKLKMATAWVICDDDGTPIAVSAKDKTVDGRKAVNMTHAAIPGLKGATAWVICDDEGKPIAVSAEGATVDGTDAVKMTHAAISGLKGAMSSGGSAPARTKKTEKQFSSKFRGVNWDKTKRQWRTQITVSGKQKNMGYNDDVMEAARAYDAAVRAQSLDKPLNLPDDLSTAPDVYVPKKKRVASSRFRGVRWDKTKQKWKAEIYFVGK